MVATVGDDLGERARGVLDQHWVEGYAVPNASVYPWQWLWDSCFHAVIWGALGDERAGVELRSLFTAQAPDGFVPHMTYHHDPDAQAAFWGRSGASSITQPPMYGHAIAELVRAGVEVAPATIDRATAGLRFLLDIRQRHGDSGMVELCHPWESGADDDPRWDDCCPDGWAIDRWYQHKGDLVATIEETGHGSPRCNPDFGVASVGFNALIAFNAEELAEVTGDAGLARDADVLVDLIDGRWNDRDGVWVDAGITASGSAAARTAYGLLPVLVSRRSDAVDRSVGALADPTAFASDFGPRGVHPAEATYMPDAYWRGPVWPQLAYLLWLALRRRSLAHAGAIADTTRAGARASGFAEYWSPVDGRGLGAIPQSWTGVVALMSR